MQISETASKQSGRRVTFLYGQFVPGVIYGHDMSMQMMACGKWPTIIASVIVIKYNSKAEIELTYFAWKYNIKYNINHNNY